LQVDADKTQEEGEDTEHLPQYQHNPQGPSSEVKVNQHIRFNLIPHRNSDSSIPTLKLFKSFRTALRSADQFLLALPVNSAKQNLPALSNLTQINNTDQNKIFTYFKPYFTKQMYSLSGYFHVSSSMSLQELMASSTIYEWLEINRYTIKQSPSNAEEMVQIGALCFGSEYIYQEDLKMAITQHPEWSFPTLPEPPIIHLTKGDFRGPEKSTKMIFVCAERSKQVEAGDFFSRLYDGTSKNYPNGIMMLYIPLNDNIVYEPAYRQKVIFNHEHYLGNEAALCIQGLSDLNTKVTLKNNTEVTLRLLLRSLPASKGMWTPQLFTLVEQSNSGNVVLAAYHAEDQDHISARKLALEAEIRQVLAKGETAKVFQSEVDGIWFNNVSKTKTGNLRKVVQTSKANMDHI